MTTTPIMTAADGELRMGVPYPLNGAFRAIFKTAKWNPSAKVFVAAATTKNRNKWEQFLISVKGAVEALAVADEAEATADELERAARETDLALAKVRASIAEFEQRANVARNRKIRADEQLTELAPVLDQANAALVELLSITAVAEEARDAVIAPALALYEHHGLSTILSDFTRAARRGYSGKDACGRAQHEIIALRNDLKTIGFRLSAIDDLASVSLNRPDKIVEYVAAAEASLRTGLYTIEITD